jgi:hypothetical protein
MIHRRPISYTGTLFYLRVEPLERIILTKDGTIDPIAIVFYNLFSVDAVQSVFPLIKATAVGAVFRGPEDTDVDVCVVQSRQLDLAEEVQTVGGGGNPDGFEIFGGEGG